MNEIPDKIEADSIIPKEYMSLWSKVEPLMSKVKKKDYVLHVLLVTRAMKALIAEEGGDGAVLIPAAILHDVGWSEVPMNLQLTQEKAEKEQAGRMHIENAPKIIRRILTELGYEKDMIEKVTIIVRAHKYADPETLTHEQKMLIDADNLSDLFSEAIESDAESYGNTPSEQLTFRSQNTYFTEAARVVHEREYSRRLVEQKESEDYGE